MRWPQRAWPSRRNGHDPNEQVHLSLLINVTHARRKEWAMPRENPEVRLHEEATRGRRSQGWVCSGGGRAARSSPGRGSSCARPWGQTGTRHVPEAAGRPESAAGREAGATGRATTGGPVDGQSFRFYPGGQPSGACVLNMSPWLLRGEQIPGASTETGTGWAEDYESRAGEGTRKG